MMSVVVNVVLEKTFEGMALLLSGCLATVIQLAIADRLLHVFLHLQRSRSRKKRDAAAVTKGKRKVIRGTQTYQELRTSKRE